MKYTDGVQHIWRADEVGHDLTPVKTGPLKIGDAEPGYYFSAESMRDIAGSIFGSIQPPAQDEDKVPENPGLTD